MPKREPMIPALPPLLLSVRLSPSLFFARVPFPCFSLSLSLFVYVSPRRVFMGHDDSFRCITCLFRFMGHAYVTYITFINAMNEQYIYVKYLMIMHAVYLARFGGLTELTWAMKNGNQDVKVEAAGVSLCVCLCVYVSLCLCVSLSLCLCVCIYTYIHIEMHEYICIYVCIYENYMK